MRAHLTGSPEAAAFADLLLQVGNGSLPPSETPDTIAIPAGPCQFADTLEELKTRVFPDLQQNGRNPEWLAHWAIISSLNETVNRLNTILMADFPGVARTYVSINTAKSDEKAVLYPQQLLSSIELSDLPPHKLTLKPGSHIIILRSLEPPKTTNGTRCVITRLHNYIIEATISCGPFKGEPVLLPRIPLEPSDCPLPFKFRRLQFPV
jgi:ATP-dependent DNA helicase PIF1